MEGNRSCSLAEEDSECSDDGDLERAQGLTMDFEDDARHEQLKATIDNFKTIINASLCESKCCKSQAEILEMIRTTTAVVKQQSIAEFSSTGNHTPVLRGNSGDDDYHGMRVTERKTSAFSPIGSSKNMAPRSRPKSNRR